MSIGVTLSELDRRVRSKLSESETTYFTSQNVLDWLNEGQDVVAMDAPYTAISEWQQNCTPQGTSYLLPTEMIAPVMTSVRDSGGRVYRLSYLDEDVLDQQRSWSTGVSGRPRLCTYRMTEEGVAVDLWPSPTPSPGTTLILYVAGYLRPATLSASTDRSDIPPWAASVIVDYAVWQAKIKDEENAEAQRAQQQFETGLMRLYERRILIQGDSFPSPRDYRAIGGYRWPYT